jgi:transglutaminase-like putative cysteine protease
MRQSAVGFLLLVALAGAASAQEKADLLTTTLIPVAVPVDLKAELVRYRVSSGKRPVTLTETAGQTLDRKSPTVVEVTVRRVAPPADSTEQLPIKPTRDLQRYLEANYFLECDTAVIKDLAAKALDGEKNAAAAARKLEKFVHEYIGKKTLAIAFATAKQTAQSRAGDCTEHAVLLAALARAAGIPARVVGGMVYADEFVGKKQLFGYHMWAELYVAGGWYPFDAALHRRGGYGVGHIAQITSDLSALSAEIQLSVGLMNTLGDLKVDVLEQKK